MPYDASQKAALTKKRGEASNYISDVKEKQKFVAAQGDAEAKGKDSNASDEDYARLDREADDTIATQGTNKSVGVPSYKHGTTHVPKTGLAKLHEGEAVIPAESNPYAMITGAHEKPKKEIKEVRTRKAKSGGYIHEHHFTRPDAHPMEEHTSPDQAGMLQHMAENMGSDPDAAMPSA